MTVRQFFAVVELRTKVISVSTYLVATLYTIATGHRVTVLEAVLLAIAVLCVDMGTTAFNTFYDHYRGVDTRHTTVEPGKVLVHEGVAPGWVLIISFSLYAIAGVTGIFVSLFSSWWVLVAGMVSMLVGFLYNAGPLPISRTPLGEIFAGGFLGGVLFLVIYAVHTGGVDRAAVVAAVPSTLLIAAVLTVNNTCDLDGDRLKGRRTLSVLVGRRVAVLIIDVLCIAAFGLVLASTLAPHGSGPGMVISPASPAASIVAAVGVALAIATLAGMHKRGYAKTTKHPNMSAISRLVAIFTVVYASVLALAI